MVDRLEADGDLQPGPVRDALLALPREVLMPQAYVRRSKSEENPPRWDLLEWTAVADREELLRILYSGGSVLIQHDGEPILSRIPGPRSGGQITSMSSTVGMTAGLLQELDLRPGHRVLDVGTGAGVTAAVASFVCGDVGVVTLDRDRHVSAAARARLAALGYQPAVVTGDGAAGWPGGAPYERIFLSYAIGRAPEALVEQLAPGGRALANLTGMSPSWPGLAVITRTAGGRVEAELRAVEFGHRPGHGFERIFLSRAFLDRIATGEGAQTFSSRIGPPPDEPRALWLALEGLFPGLVRNWGADHLMLGAPACGSWVTAQVDGAGGWTVCSHGPRDIWEEIQTTAARWYAAGRPDAYRLHLDPGGRQWVSASTGRAELSWNLPLPHSNASS
ncbi:protein-L-isoaspartate O-methyltransferase [Streptomyces albus subsp. albus]|nr:protein-L-isoaspartate O-methyltransferase [Streptomyces albus subsp. albus]